MSATSQKLLRLAADSLVHSEHVDTAIDSVRRTFGLDGACVLRWNVDSWSVEVAHGETTVVTPESAQFSVEIASGRVLALEGSRMTVDEVAALRSFLDQIRFAREPALLAEIGGSREDGDDAVPG